MNIKVNELNVGRAVQKGYVVYCYKRSFNNVPKRFYFSKTANFKPYHIYVINSQIVFRGRDNKLYVAGVLPAHSDREISKLVQSGATVQEAIEFLNL